MLNGLFPWQRRSKVAHTTSARIDVSTVLYCGLCHMSMLRNDLDEEGKCGRCHGEVADITSTPEGKSWLALVAPKAPSKDRRNQ